MSKDHQHYLDALVSELQRLYQIANKAREKGFDPELEAEPKVAKDLAELVEGLVGPREVAKSIRELSKKLPREELAFKVAEEIVYGKFGHLDVQEAAEQAVRTSLAILTEGITAAPLQGVAKVSIKSNLDQTKYLAIYYAGPIRSAGGTDQALTLVIGDFVRRLLGLDRYKPTEEEINRFIEEMRLYERNVGRFQYHVDDEQLRMAIELIPVEATGTESDPVEVQSFRNLPRIETNRVRGGTLRVVNDGVIGRATKVSAIVEKLGVEGWDWLKHVGEAKGTEKRDSADFMKDIIAGRPIFSFPSHPCGFRLRYGRARNTGLTAIGVHPLTMMILNQFLAGGTQVRIELPGKGGIVTPVDTIEPPVVLLTDGSVVRAGLQNFPQIKTKISKILFLGDLLISFGDFLYNGKKLRPSGYTEEWWAEDLKARVAKGFGGNLEDAAAAASISAERLEGLISSPFYSKPTVEEAFAMARSVNVPLHPNYSFLWSNITTEELHELRRWVLTSRVAKKDGQASEIVGEKSVRVKGILERLCLPHRVTENAIIVEGDEAFALVSCLGKNSATLEVDDEVASPIEALKRLSGITVRRRTPTTIGARMGRPEKAKRREMRPKVHLLFPVGLAGGAQRNLVEAAQKGMVQVDLVNRRCPNCQEPTLRTRCPSCNIETLVERCCPRCGRRVDNDVCPACRVKSQGFKLQRLDLRTMINKACQRLDVGQPDVLKGVRGLSNEKKIAEAVEKGVLRAREDLSIYKDGTIRFDATNAPLTHFKPVEVKVPVKKLRQLGYAADFRGNSLEDEDQICELRVQDVVIPLKSGEYFVQVAAFIDQLLEKVYELPRFYNVKTPEDLVGHLAIGLAPHTSVGILGRIIGFTDLSVCYAHPIWHSAKRRDCDGDEDALMLALDTLLNFSKSYLPSQIGGIMDAPLFIIPAVNPMEVQRQAHEFDIANRYPLAFYEKTLEKAAPWKVVKLVDLVSQKLGTAAQFEGFGFTTPVSDINMGNRESMYKKLVKMTDKLRSQLELAERIEAVDARQVASKVLTTHFLRDISGNLRAFSTQGFRCRVCNRRFRRLPLKGKCPKCGGVLSLTVYRGGIEKYLDAAQNLIEKYRLPKYYLDRLTLVKEEIRTLFEGKRPRQVSLADFA